MVFVILALTLHEAIVPRSLGPYILALVFTSLTCILAEGISVNIYSILKGFPRWRRTYLMGRASAIVTFITPVLGFFSLLGVMRIKLRYRITPKGLNPITKDFVVVTPLALLYTTLFILAIYIGNKLLSIIMSPFAASAIYILIRLCLEMRSRFRSITS